MTPKVITEAKRLPSGAVNVQYRAGRYFGAVMFDADGRYADATKSTKSGVGRAFVETHKDLPAGVYTAAHEARRALGLIATLSFGPRR